MFTNMNDILRASSADPPDQAEVENEVILRQLGDTSGSKLLVLAGSLKHSGMC